MRILAFQGGPSPTDALFQSPLPHPNKLKTGMPYVLPRVWVFFPGYAWLRCLAANPAES